MTNSIKVLIVEDDPASMNYLEIILNKEGLEYKTASNGEEGLEIFKQYHPHIVLTDINMPRMSGIEMLSAIKQINSQTIVIMLTAFNSEKYVIESMKYGANNYLKKPILKENIIGLLRKYKSIIYARTQHKQIQHFIQSHSFSMKFKNDINQVPFIVNYLIDEIEVLFKEDETMGIRLGLNEIIINAIEHGNLNISYREKSEAIQQNVFEKLISERALLKENILKKVIIAYEFRENYCEWIIQDEGSGFNPSIIPNPITDVGTEQLHGRGIFITRFHFDELEYYGNGNRVRMRKYIK
ncbi:MAG: response regulator [Bacteroidales bacterium]